MNKRLFVGGLPYETTESDLREMFSKSGTVESCTVIMDRFTSRSKGFAFVEMTTDEEAQNAIKTFDGTDLGGRKIIVNVARPLEDRPQRNDGGNDRGGRGGSRGGGSGGDRNFRRNRW